MPALKNPKHEAFCRAYVSGKTAGNATASHKAVGYKPSRRNASALLQRQDISGRVAELQARVARIEEEATEKAAAELGITKARVLSELAKIGFSNMLDYIRITGAGDAYVDLSALDRDKAACIQEVMVDSYDEGRGDSARTVKRIKFRLCDKRGALVDIGRHFGMFVDVVKNPDVAEVMKKFVDAPPPETREQWLARRNKELAVKAPTSAPAKAVQRRK
jgi:phage terminase small subunit